MKIKIAFVKWRQRFKLDRRLVLQEYLRGPMNLAFPNLSLGFLKFELGRNLYFGISKNMRARKIQKRITHMEAIAGWVRSRMRGLKPEGC